MSAHVARWCIALYSHAQVEAHSLFFVDRICRYFNRSRLVNIGFIRIYILIAHLWVTNNTSLLGNYMHQVGTVKIFITKHPEDVIDDRSSALDIGMSHYHTCRLKAG